MIRTGIVLKAVSMTGLVTLLLAPGAAAHPADVFLFPVTPVVPPPMPCNPITSSPCYMLNPLTVVGVTPVGPLPGTVTGAGACNVSFEACFAWPVWNPNWAPAPGQAATGAVPRYWWCEVTWHTPNWAAGPIQSIQAHIVYDANNDDLLTAGDIVYSTVAAPPPPPPPGAPMAPRMGQWTGGAFGPSFPAFPAPPGSLFPWGSIVHVVITDPLGNPLLPDIARDTAVTCWVY
jgi:hypothetical protein